ncbi:MAG: GC-type dockerin domain-anchored protein [Planctomycetota bacterium]
MKSTSIAIAALLLSGGAASAQIDFEERLEGEPIDTQFADLGITFSTGRGTASISNWQTYFGTLSICNATQGGLGLDRDLTLIMEFDPPLSHIEFDWHTAGMPGSDSPIRFYAGGTLVDDDLLPQTGDDWQRGVAFDGLDSVDRIEIDSGGGSLWLFSIDNISFGVLDCFANFDRDGELTLFDFLGFQNAFDAGDPAADCDEDGELTLFDFLCFQNLFDVGCE